MNTQKMYKTFVNRSPIKKQGVLALEADRSEYGKSQQQFSKSSRFAWIRRTHIFFHYFVHFLTHYVYVFFTHKATKLCKLMDDQKNQSRNIQIKILTWIKQNNSSKTGKLRFVHSNFS